MEKVVKLHKVSMQRFEKDWGTASPGADATETQRIYEALRLPVRATKGSVGYDSFVPAAVSLEPRETTKIPTGIRVEIQGDWMLQSFPRSSLGFTHRLQFNSTVGITDNDYFESDSGGHIFIKMMSNSTERKAVQVRKGDDFVQGIFLPLDICGDDNVQEQRNGGSGSMNEQLQGTESAAFFALYDMCTASTHTHCEYEQVYMQSSTET